MYWLRVYPDATVSLKFWHNRWEFNNAYLEQFEKASMAPAGINPEAALVEIMELKDHRWFAGVQFHPELKSTVERPHPLFVAFVNACIG